MIRENLGFLSNQKKTLILGLPKDTNAILVNYDESIVVYCTLPPQKREISLGGTGQLEVSCPSLMFRSEFSDIPAYGNIDIGASHAIYAFNDQVKEKIIATPYYISNVYGSAEICFGDMEAPFSPQEAFNLFWASPFNSELRGEEERAFRDAPQYPVTSIGEEEFEEPEEDFYYQDLDDLDLPDYINEYHAKGLAHQKWDDLTDNICQGNFWASPEGADGLLICGNKHLLGKIPFKFWRKNRDGYPFIIALAFKHDDHWEFRSGGFEFCLDKGFVTLLPRFSEEVSQLKRQYKA